MYDCLPDRTSFRLLRLLPGREQDPIRCYLHTYQSEDKLKVPDYEALSYVWNLSPETSQVSCNDHDIKATANLADALFRLRHESEIRLLWVDALCINQADLKEREHQVRLMGHIFSSASRVLIWLGRDDLNVAETACDLICATIIRDREWMVIEKEESQEDLASSSNDNDSLAKQWARRQEKPLRLSLRKIDLDGPAARFLLNREPSYFRGNSSSPIYFQKDEPPLSFHTDRWDAMRVLWSNPWFQRTWIIQELVLSSNALVVWGNIAIQWDWIDSATTILGNPLLVGGVDEYTHHMSALSDLTRFISGTPENRAKDLSIWGLLQRTRSFKASDPRDKIYGLLALVQNNRSHGVSSPVGLFMEPDYTIPTVQVYISAAKKLLEESRWVNILLSVCHDHGSHNYTAGPPLVLASWVPDWSRVPRAKVFELYHDSVHRGRPTVVQQPTFSSEGHLCLAGVQIARIRKVLPVCGSKTSSQIKKLDETIFTIIDSCLAEGVSVATLCDALTTSMLLVEYIFLIKDKTLPAARRMFVDDFSAFIQAGVGESRYDELVRKYGLEPAPNKHADAFSRIAVTWCDGRRIFFMEDGTIGLGPAGTREDDVICFFNGSSFPFALRKEASRYRFIGACYIDGLQLNNEESKNFWIV